MQHQPQTKRTTLIIIQINFITQTALIVDLIKTGFTPHENKAGYGNLTSDQHENAGLPIMGGRMGGHPLPPTRPKIGPIPH